VRFRDNGVEINGHTSDDVQHLENENMIQRSIESGDDPRTPRGKRVLALFNPKARAVADNVNAVAEALSAQGFDVIRPEAETRDALARLVREYADKVDLVVAIGGDGTLNAALQGLIETKLPLGIVPLGTANDLCKTLGIPLDLEDACNVIAHGHARPIDVGRVNGTYYFNESSIGLSVAVSRKLSAQAKKRFGVVAIFFEALNILIRMRRFRAIVKADDQREIALHTAQLTIGNSRNFGGLVSTDDASIDDRRLDLYSVEFRHWWSYFEALLSLLRRRYDDAKSVFTLHARRFEVRTGRPMTIEADGEIVSKTPAVFEVIPLAVRVLVPDPKPPAA
jgi:diacylglycerol kinase (ATP)